jgi:hypothetical protein
MLVSFKMRSFREPHRLPDLKRFGSETHGSISFICRGRVVSGIGVGSPVSPHFHGAPNDRAQACRQHYGLWRQQGDNTPGFRSAILGPSSPI